MLWRERILARDTVSYLQSYIESTDSVLDVGSGNGLVAQQIRDVTGADVDCIDVIDIDIVGVPPTIFDGRHIPFPDNRFDVVICCFVLHHTPNQEELLAELRRVSRRAVILLEDTPESTIDRALTTLHMLSSKFRYGSKGMSFHNRSEWRDLLLQSGFSVDAEEVIPSTRDLLYPVRRSLFALSFGSAAWPSQAAAMRRE